MTNNDHRTTSPGFRISVLYRLNALLHARNMVPLGVLRGQVPFLAAVLEHEGLTQDEISKMVMVDPGATARALSALEVLDLVRRRENEHNRRQNLVYPTDKARDLAPDFYHILEQGADMLFRGFSPDDRAQSLALLDRMIANLKEDLGVDGPDV